MLQKQKSIVDEMRGQQDEVMKQVLQVQLVMQELLKSRQRAEEARRKIAKTDNEDEKLQLPWLHRVQFTLQQPRLYAREMSCSTLLLTYFVVRS